MERYILMSSKYSMIALLAMLAVLILSIQMVMQDTTETTDLTGYWETVEETPFKMSALVSDGVMEINLVHETTRGLYWVGTVPNEVTSGETFTSVGDTEAMSVSILGSLLESKDFTYTNNHIMFDFSIMGITQTVTMERLN